MLLFVFLLISSIAFSQSNYYVATNGNNANTGSLNSPWKTIQYGIDQLKPGDVLNIKAGTYKEIIEIGVSGTPGKYITIKNYQNDEVIIDGSEIDLAVFSLLWTDQAYLRIQGIHFTNAIGNDKEGISLQGGAHHIEILNNKISNIKYTAVHDNTVTFDENAVPLNVYADSPTDSIHNILIKGNEIFNNVSGYSENISVGGNLSTFIIEDNIIHDNTNIGIDVGGNYDIGDPIPVPANLNHGRYGIIRNNLVYNCNSPYSTAAGIYIDGGRNIIVENNICYHNGYGGEIGCEENGDTSNITFRNNIFYENFYTGMHIGAYDADQPLAIVKNAYVYNNTFYNNDTGLTESGEFTLTKSKNCRIMNNIFYVSSQNVFFSSSRTQENLTIDYNLVYNDAGANALVTYGNNEYTGLQNLYDATGFGAHSSYGNPKFVNVSGNDFHIMDTSPAINAGDPNYTSTTGNMNIPGITINNVDMDGQPRVNNIVDCGADESTVSLGINDVAYQTISVYPNPTYNKIFIPETIQHANYQIFSYLGKRIAKGKINSNSIDLSKLQQGLYFVLLNSGAKHFAFKVLKVE